MRLLPLLALLIALPVIAAPDKIAPPGLRTDKPVATITNADGDTLSFSWRSAKGDYLVLLEFRRGGGGEFALEMPLYQPDAYIEPLETEWMREREATGRQNLGDVEPTRIWWVEWMDRDNVVASGMVFHSVLRSKQMTITYRAADGAERTARFDISGLRAALAAATDIKIED